MAKIRNIPFGYRIVNGKITVYEDEAMTVKRIFRLYCDGNSLGYIATMLTDERIRYSDATDEWNKSRISRILTNPIYLGDERYPPIVSPYVFEKSSVLKESPHSYERCTEKVCLLCAACEKRLLRRFPHNREALYCKTCGQYIHVSPNDISDRMKMLYDYLSRNAEMLIPKNHVESVCQKPDIKLYELRNMLMQSDFDQDEVLQFIVDIAKIEYNSSNVGSDILARRLKNRIERASCDVKVSVEFIQEYIDKVCVDKRGNIILHMTTGVQIYERSVIDGSHKNPEKNGESA